MIIIAFTSGIDGGGSAESAGWNSYTLFMGIGGLAVTTWGINGVKNRNKSGKK